MNSLSIILISRSHLALNYLNHNWGDNYNTIVWIILNSSTAGRISAMMCDSVLPFNTVFVLGVFGFGLICVPIFMLFAITLFRFCYEWSTGPAEFSYLATLRTSKLVNFFVSDIICAYFVSFPQTCKHYSYAEWSHCAGTTGFSEFITTQRCRPTLRHSETSDNPSTKDYWP